MVTVGVHMSLQVPLNYKKLVGLLFLKNNFLMILLPSNDRLHFTTLSALGSAAILWFGDFVHDYACIRSENDLFKIFIFNTDVKQKYSSDNISKEKLSSEASDQWQCLENMYSEHRNWQYVEQDVVTFLSQLREHSEHLLFLTDRLSDMDRDCKQSLWPPWRFHIISTAFPNIEAK